MNKPSEENISQENISGNSHYDDTVIFSNTDQRSSGSHRSGEKKTSSDILDTEGYKFLKSKKSGRHHSHHSSHGSGHSHHGTRVRKRRRRKMKTWKKVLIIVVSVILAIAIAVAGTMIYLINTGQSELFDANLNVIVPEEVPAQVQDDGDYIEYKGATYQYNKDVTNILFLGIDKNLDEENEMSTGGQADMLVMIAMNTKKHKMTMIAIPRDTMTEVALYTPSGRYTGMDTMQVCLAYAYGDGKETSCENTVSSARKIFYNIPVKTYYALDLDGIAAMNDCVGGIDVVSPETITSFVKGESYHLVGRQAEHFVRDRDQTTVNASLQRLERQKVYAKSFLATMLSKIKSDVTSAVSVFNDSAPYSCTNLNAAKVAYLAKEFAFGGGMTTEMISIPGKMENNNDRAEYKIDENAFFEQFLSVYYERVR